MPEVFETYLGVRDRELALAAVALAAADPRDPEDEAARAGIDAVERLLDRVGQRRSLNAQGLDSETHATIAQDAVDDAAIRNSPRLPSRDDILRILAAVAG
jgi:alcohol dehydrogenase class IV